MSRSPSKTKRQRLSKCYCRDFDALLDASGIPDIMATTFNAFLDAHSAKEKMSGVLLDFMEPFMERAKTFREFQKLVAAAAIAWNTALFPEDRRSAILHNSLAKAYPSPLPRRALHWLARLFRVSSPSLAIGKEGLLLKATIDELIERKLRHFSTNRRCIAGFEIVEMPDGKHELQVVSTPTNECPTP